MKTSGAGRSVRLTGGLIAWLVFAGVSAIGVAQEMKGRDYDLEIEGNLVSLKAVDVSLAPLLRDLGGRLGFTVDAEIGDELKVSANFRRQSVTDAISNLCKPVGYVLVRSPVDDRVERLVLTPSRVISNRAAARRAEPPGWRPPDPPPDSALDEQPLDHGRGSRDPDSEPQFEKDDGD